MQTTKCIIYNMYAEILIQHGSKHSAKFNGLVNSIVGIVAKINGLVSSILKVAAEVTIFVILHNSNIIVTKVL